MKRNSTLLLAALQMLAVTVFAQTETKPVQVQNNKGEIEEYGVLTTNRKVRQGPYVRYRPSTFAGLVVLESGSYDRGLKEGEWRTFSQDRPWNNLVSVGSYRTGLAEGMWVYYQYKFASGGPFTQASTPIAQAVPKEASSKAGYSVNINDTTAVVQAQGLCTQGLRVGVWVYYDRKAQVIQKVDHFTNRLIYWRPENGLVVSGEAAATHPLLYLGGKERLTEEIFRSMDPHTYYDAAKSGAIEFVFAVDAAGRQTAVSLAKQAMPTRYEKLLLATLGKVPATWLPQAVLGKPEAAEYRIRITTRAEMVGGHRSVGTSVEALGN